MTYGKRDSPLEYVQKIENVTAKDIMRVAQRMFEKPPSVGAVGHNLSKLPSFELIKDYTDSLRQENPANIYRSQESASTDASEF